jgi:hypothetical protein
MKPIPACGAPAIMRLTGPREKKIPSTPRRGDQEIKRVSAENQLSDRRRHDDLQLLAS